MPVPNRTRNKDGTFRRKRSDVGKVRKYTKVVLEGTDEQIEYTLEEFKKNDIKYKEVK